MIQRQHRKRYGHFGNYVNFSQALKDSTGYETATIISKIKKDTEELIKNQTEYVPDDQAKTIFFLLGLNPQRGFNVVDLGGVVGTLLCNI